MICEESRPIGYICITVTSPITKGMSQESSDVGKIIRAGGK